jgi:spore coat polysaccharide biosynthesis protein SpsF
MNIGVIIQARMGSTRLPGKVMLNLMGKTVLEHVVDRCKQISSATDVLIATTNLEKDNVIEHDAKRLGVFCYRGSEENVLNRYYEAAKARNLDVVIRITSDCPLIDPELSTEIVEAFLNDPLCDYCTNSLERSYPRGLDLEIFTFKALEQANLEAESLYEFEHVTPYIHDHPEKFRIKSFKGTENYSDYRWTLDTFEDWQLIQEIYKKLYIPNEIFSWKQGILLMEQFPELIEINKHIEQKTT